MQQSISTEARLPLCDQEALERHLRYRRVRMSNRLSKKDEDVSGKRRPHGSIVVVHDNKLGVSVMAGCYVLYVE